MKIDRNIIREHEDEEFIEASAYNYEEILRQAMEHRHEDGSKEVAELVRWFEVYGGGRDWTGECYSFKLNGHDYSLYPVYDFGDISDEDIENILYFDEYLTGWEIRY